jgi:hypothetical protein
LQLYNLSQIKTNAHDEAIGPPIKILSIPISIYHTTWA